MGSKKRVTVEEAAFPHNLSVESESMATPVHPAVIATLGMFIIDTVRYEDAAGADCGDRGFGEQIGGGGTHWAVGARMWLAPRSIRMIVDRGDDFPASVQQDLDRYAAATSEDVSGSGPWQFRSRQGKTTKAVNVYKLAEPRGFAYLTPKRRLDPIDLIDEMHTHLPDFIHCICSPERLAAICSQVDDELRTKWPASGTRPCIVWEPIPDSAAYENLTDIVQVAASVDVISPNHEELAAMLGVTMEEKLLGKTFVENMAKQLLEQIQQQHPGVVPPVLCVRCAALGALTSVPLQASTSELVWVDAYFDSTMQHRLVDVTGAGNSFLGGFTVGLQQTGQTAKGRWTADELRRATEMGAISASYTIEAIGVPRITTQSTIEECWNDGESPQDRLAAFRQRCKQS